MAKLTEIHGHRGARGRYPENTLVGIEAAVASGCDAVEFDVCVTRDDQLVLTHDPVMAHHLVRDREGDWIESEIRVRQLDLDELREFDVGRIRPGSEYASRFSGQTSVDGTTIPTLDEAASLLRSMPDVGLNIELKSTPYDCDATPDTEKYVSLVADRLSSHDLTGRCVLQSFDWRLPLGVKRRLPDLRIGLTSDNQPGGHPVSPKAGDPTPWTGFRDLSEFFGDVPEMVQALGGNIWSSNFRDLDFEKIDRARELGLEVFAWTVNSPDDMERMIDWQVDAVITDYPDRMFALVHGKPAATA